MHFSRAESQSKKETFSTDSNGEVHNIWLNFVSFFLR